ncbi:MAG: hypothetical protein IPO21_07690 [Bacteroidales bacterium]|nr:hypothetical protein [Bacteroidales bacterium]
MFDSKGRLWIGTWNGGINMMRNENEGFFSYQNNEKLGINSTQLQTIAALYETKNGDVICGTWGYGAYIYNDEKQYFQPLFNYFGIDAPLNSDKYIVRSIFEDKQGKIYIGAFQKGLIIFDPKTKKTQIYEHDEYVSSTISSNNILRIIEDSSDVLWIATVGGGLSYFDLSSIAPHYYESQLHSDFRISSNKVSSTAIDNTGRIWISTYDKGLNIVDEKNKKTVSLNTKNSNIQSDVIFNLIEADKNNVWLATASGLSIVNKTTLQSINIEGEFNDSTKPSANDLCEIYLDRDSIIWIGYFAHGISSYNLKTKQFKHYLHDSRNSQNLTYNPVNSFYKDLSGMLWVGMEQGLVKFNTKTNVFTYYRHNADDSSSIPEENVQSICEDSNGLLWIGTYGGGLLSFDTKKQKFEQYTVKNGLSIDVIKGVYADNHDRIWLATGKGISIYYKKQNTFLNLYDNFGYKPVFYNNITPINDSILSFAGGGVCLVNINTIKESNFIPKVNIVKLSLYNKPIRIGEKINDRIILEKAIESCNEIELSYKENVFTLNFSAMHFSSPQNIKYRYLLEGFDKEWSYTDAYRASATYTNLKGGTYVFKVYATNADGIWNGAYKELTIIITPPFWQTTWFRIIFSLCALYIIYLITSSVVRKKQLEFEKKQVNQEHEITKLKNEKLHTEIEVQNQKLLKKSSDLTSSVVNNTRKNEVMLKLKTKLEDVSENVNDQAKREIGKLIREIKQDLDIDENWDQFEIHFNEVHNNFIERLKKEYPELTPSNLKMCAYLRMNLSSKEIATLLNISISGVEKSRYRLRKKLNLETEDNLVEFIMDF